MKLCKSLLTNAYIVSYYHVSLNDDLKILVLIGYFYKRKVKLESFLSYMHIAISGETSGHLK